uniref:ATP binding cassette subfamily A member 2 n=1 Tax=Ornithorhynchus anatinus TaxID=9258 RepID=A0A6I8PE90_ORNAN
MGFLHQLHLLLWKNVTLKRRSPWVLAFEIFIPLVLFFILLGLRQKKPTISVKEVSSVLHGGPPDLGGHPARDAVPVPRRSERRVRLSPVLQLHSDPAAGTAHRGGGRKRPVRPGPAQPGGGAGVPAAPSGVPQRQRQLRLRGQPLPPDRSGGQPPSVRPPAGPGAGTT